MLDQNFSASNFLKLTTKADPRKHNLGRQKSDYRRTFERISNEIHGESYAFSNQCKVEINGEFIYKTTNTTDVFVLRKLADNLTRLYDAKQASRSQIVEQVIAMLNEKIPYYVIKLDIKKFYNNLNGEDVIDFINRDSRLSYHTRRFLGLLTRTTAFAENSGLPRGLGVSAAISEIALKNFDRNVSRVNGVYYYARYVDDMIIFTFQDPYSVIGEVKKLLPSSLRLNDSKEKIIFHDKSGFSCECGDPEFDYLGYNFFSHKDISGSRKIRVKIAEKKIKKLKTKVMLSLHDLIHTKNFDLCVLRLKFLTANVAMKSSANFGQLYSGIFFNYPKADSDIVREQLKELDDFTRKAIYSRKKAFGLGLQNSITSAQRSILARYSFLVGYERKIKYDFNRDKLIEIARCWK